MSMSLMLSSQNYIGPKADIDQILENTRLFSTYVVNQDVESIGMSYTSDAKIFAGNRDIIEGRKLIMDYWTPQGNGKNTHHKITSHEIKVTSDEAYDYGVYEGSTLQSDSTTVDWQGKYVVIWKKDDGKWRMYLDIWNRSPAPEGSE
jgi:ketosteroid isomerase-like protein